MAHGWWTQGAPQKKALWISVKKISLGKLKDSDIYAKLLISQGQQLQD